MSPTAPSPPGSHCKLLFPDWSGTRPLSFFMLEDLLEARAQSSFPTGSRCSDEDVNVYLAHLLAEHLYDPVPTGVTGGGEPLLLPPEKETRLPRHSVDHYRRNGDHRLLCLGLYGRGNLCRRRHPPWGWSEVAVRERDLADGRSCYHVAANMLRGCRISCSALLPVLNKLARHFEGYVHVLQILARLRFGLGAQLSPDDLHDLASQDQPDVDSASADDQNTMDNLLDLLSAYHREPSPELALCLRTTAQRLGIDPDHLLGKNQD